MKSCSHCGHGPLNARNVRGYCMTCLYNRNCSDCGKKIGEKSKARCRSCANQMKAADPTVSANRSAGMRRRWARELQDPAKRAALVSSGKRLNANHPSTPETRAKQLASRKTWVPEGYADLNRALVKKKLSAPERRRIIAAQQAEDERKRLAALSPFERQMQRLRDGARLVEVKPLRRADYDYSLTGCASGWL